MDIRIPRAGMLVGKHFWPPKALLGSLEEPPVWPTLSSSASASPLPPPTSRLSLSRLTFPVGPSVVFRLPAGSDSKGCTAPTCCLEVSRGGAAAYPRGEGWRRVTSVEKGEGASGQPSSYGTGLAASSQASGGPHPHPPELSPPGCSPSSGPSPTAAPRRPRATLLAGGCRLPLRG